MATTPTAQAAGALRPAGFLLGFALGGFFDGILLHQVLQWHHLLSNVQGLQDLRLQVLADGLFHGLMYVLAVLALVLLWRRRAALLAPAAGRVLWALALLGFGAWHILDSILSHWITGIHRIRVDAADPLLWDLLWFGLFGLLPVVLGWLAWRKAGPGAGGPGRAVAATLALATVVAGPLAALPANDTDQVMVLFAPGVSSARAFQALAAVDARVLWVDRSGGLWAVALREPRAAAGLYGRGALLVSSAGGTLGCFGWSRVAAPGS